MMFLQLSIVLRELSEQRVYTTREGKTTGYSPFEGRAVPLKHFYVCWSFDLIPPS